MQALRNLWNAFANLTNAVNGLANIVNDAGNRLRMQLDYEPPAMPALPHNGIIDHTDAESSPSTKRSRKASA